MGHVCGGVAELGRSQPAAPRHGLGGFVEGYPEVALCHGLKAIPFLPAPGGQQPTGRHGVAEGGQDQPALHPEPEGVKLQVVPDDGGGGQDRGQSPEVVADSLEVQVPGVGTGYGEGQQADVALPRIDGIVLAGAVGFDVQGDWCAIQGKPLGDRSQLTRIDRNPNRDRVGCWRDTWDTSFGPIYRQRGSYLLRYLLARIRARVWEWCPKCPENALSDDFHAKFSPMKPTPRNPRSF